MQVVSATSVHKSSVRGVEYNPVTATLVSSSGDPRASLVLWGPDHATKTYTFSMPKVKIISNRALGDSHDTTFNLFKASA